MPQSFSLASGRCAVVTDPSLWTEIQAHTENSVATSRILSSIGRFGGDPTIQRYEMTPLPHNRTTRLAGSVAWTVRAVRARAPGAP